MAPIDSDRETRNSKNKQAQSSTPNKNDEMMKKIINSNMEILQSNKTILQKVTEMEKALEFLSSKYDELKIKYELVIQENVQIKKANNDIIIQNNTVKGDIQQLQQTLNNIKQENMKKNIVLFGAPSVANPHSLNVIFQKLLDHLNINREEVELEDIYQMKTNEPQAPIFIKFKHYKTKIDFMQANKNMRTFANNIGFDNNNNKIILADQLTENNRNLLKEAKSLRNHGFKHIWVKNGNVLVRKSDNSEVIIVKTLNDIRNLKSQNVTL